MWIGELTDFEVTLETYRMMTKEAPDKTEDTLKRNNNNNKKDLSIRFLPIEQHRK
jgi:hypothetical protein